LQFGSTRIKPELKDYRGKDFWNRWSFVIAGPRAWNNLPDAIRDSSLLSFLTFAKLEIFCLFNYRGDCDI